MSLSVSLLVQYDAAFEMSSIRASSSISGTRLGIFFSMLTVLADSKAADVHSMKEGTFTSTTREHSHAIGESVYEFC